MKKALIKYTQQSKVPIIVDGHVTYQECTPTGEQAVVTLEDLPFGLVMSVRTLGGEGAVTVIVNGGHIQHAVIIRHNVDDGILIQPIHPKHVWITLLEHVSRSLRPELEKWLKANSFWTTSDSE